MFTEKTCINKKFNKVQCDAFYQNKLKFLNRNYKLQFNLRIEVSDFLQISSLNIHTYILIRKLRNLSYYMRQNRAEFTLLKIWSSSTGEIP